MQWRNVSVETAVQDFFIDCIDNISSLEDHKDVSGISLYGDNQGFVLQGRDQFTVKIFLQSKKAKVNIKNR